MSAFRLRVRSAFHWAAVCALGVTVGAHAASPYPERPLRMIVPFPAGGAADIMARGLAQQLSEQLGQQVVIENRGGAGGTPAAEAVVNSPPDGYTLLFATMGTLAINPSLYPKLRYDPVKDFEYVSLTHTTPRVLVVHPSVQARTVQELIALAKAQPGRLSYGSAGNGSSSHLSGALFASMADVQLLHVPYKGSRGACPTGPRATAAPAICPAPCLPRWPMCSCCMYRTRAARRCSTTCWPGGSA
jgi:Uncharacterized protein conserved in bacteria